MVRRGCGTCPWRGRWWRGGSEGFPSLPLLGREVARREGSRDCKMQSAKCKVQINRSASRPETGAPHQRAVSSICILQFALCILQSLRGASGLSHAGPFGLLALALIGFLVSPERRNVDGAAAPAPMNQPLPAEEPQS